MENTGAFQKRRALAGAAVILSVLILGGAGLSAGSGRKVKTAEGGLERAAGADYGAKGGGGKDFTLKLSSFTPEGAAEPDCLKHPKGEPGAVLVYDAVPQEFDWFVGGEAFPKNRNKYGIEVYKCESRAGAIVNNRGRGLDYFVKRSFDICIPKRDASGIWPAEVFPNIPSISCRDAQFLIEGPPQALDRNKNNRDKNICTRTVGAKGENPHIDKTVEFEFRESMIGKGNIVLAGRADPSNPECAGLPENPTEIPFGLSGKQLSCYLYFDDFAEVSVQKAGSEIVKTKRVQYAKGAGLHPLPGASVGIGELFTEGDGKYIVGIKVYDEGDSVYGSGDIWLTWEDAPLCG